MIAAALEERADTRRRDVKFSLRASAQDKQLIDKAAKVVGQSTTDFMIDSARKRAEEVLLDQTFFKLNAERFEAFVAVLDNPPVPSNELRKLLQSKSPWEK
jgi:uncharacterized protein (DUF1778 family)